MKSNWSNKHKQPVLDINKVITVMMECVGKKCAEQECRPMYDCGRGALDDDENGGR